MTTETEKVTSRLNDLAVESTQTLVDAAYLAQKQSAQLLQAWLGTLDSGQKQQREVVAKIIQQSQDAQGLLQKYVRESFSQGVDTFTRTAQTGVEQATNAVNGVANAANNATNQAAGTAKNASK